MAFRNGLIGERGYMHISRKVCEKRACDYLQPIRMIRPFSINSGRMSFEDYRKHRRQLKIRARLAGIPMALIDFQNPEVELAPTFLGMDPLAFAVLTGIGSGFVGFIVGGSFFTAVWSILFRKTAQEFHKRDDDFLNRLQKHRFSGINKFDDDYYADKVLTLANYRQWVRKQQKKQEFAESQSS